MVLSKHVRHCRNRYVAAVTRQLTETRAQESDASLEEVATTTTTTIDASTWRTLIQKARMSLHNRWNSVTRSGVVTEYKKNFIYLTNILSRESIDSVDNVRKFNAAQSLNDKTDGEDSLVSRKPQQGPAEPSSIKDQIYAFPQIVSALLPQFTTSKNEPPSPKSISPPKWKTNVASISEQSIASRTRHVLNSIATAESAASTAHRIDDFLDHIERFPQARHRAIKEGAVGILIRARRRSSDSQLDGSIREALTVMGHVDPLPAKGIRILSIDGGGIRGLVVLEMLKKLEHLTGQRVYEMFDYICGVSTGAIMSAVLGGHKRKSLDDISGLYKSLSTKIFTRGTIRGASNLVWSHAYYDTELWEEMLQEYVGPLDLIKTARDPDSPKFAAVSTVINPNQMMAYIFRNYTLPHRVESQYMGSHRHKLWEAVRASAAAPTYFQEFKLGEYLFADGGLMVNNPCAVAIHEAKLLWPNSPIQCVVSFGTGRTPSVIGEMNEDNKEITSTSWKEKFDKILASATDTEAVHIMLNDLLPDHVYYRFNPYLTEMLPMEEIRPDKIMQLEQDAMMYIRKNEDKFEHAANALMKKRTIMQKMGDWISLEKKIFGL